MTYRWIMAFHMTHMDSTAIANRRLCLHAGTVAKRSNAASKPDNHTFCPQCPASSRVGAAAGMPPALETEDASGQSAEEREAALAESVQTRMEELRRLATFVQRIQ